MLTLFILASFPLSIVSQSNYWTVGLNAKLTVDLDNVNNYTVSMNNTVWLIGGEPNVYCNNAWHSVSDNSLQPQSETATKFNGNDNILGPYSGLKMLYNIINCNSNNNNNAQFEIKFTYYSDIDAFIFSQTFPNGLQKTSIPQYLNPPTGNEFDVMIPISEFPVFLYDNNTILRNKLGYIEWNGRQLDSINFGIGLNDFIGGSEGGVIALFENGIKPTSSMILSTFTNFMNGIFSIRTRRDNNQNGQCVLKHGVNFEQNDVLIIHNVKSVNECCNLCYKYSYCNVFSYVGAKSNCFLKYNDRGEKTVNGSISGYAASENNNDYLVAGIEGNATFLPINYSISYVLSALSNKGIHGAMEKWGNMLLKKYETNRLQKSEDLVTRTLGYWTDNGAYYQGKKPLDTSIAQQLFSAFSANNIPIRYLQLDPYWYMGGSNTNNGFIWIPRTDLFPNGLTDLYNKIGKIPLLLYSSYWTANKTQNYYNSNYNLSLQFSNSLTFDVGWLQGPIAEPIGYESSYNFYRFIISQYSEIMMGFEVDFMNWEYDNFPVFTNGYNTMTNLSEQWTKGMQDALFEYNFSVQYCMDLPSYVLQSLQYPAVTNARATTDNFPGDKMRWKIAYTNLLLSPLSIRPFFDVIWTTSYQPGNVYNVNETDCEMEAIIASLCGPVGIGDNINQTNKTIINRIVRKDGILLQPTNALTPIDAMYSSISSFRPSGEIWMTCTSIMDNIEGYNVFAVDVFLSEYKLSFLDLYPIPNIDDKFYFYLFDDSNDNVSGQCMNNTNIKECDLRILNNSQTLNIITSAPPQNNPYHLHSWNLYNLVRIQSNGWSLLGEMNKYSNISPQRFKSIQLNINPKGMSVVVKGAPNEVITITFITDKSNILQITVNFNENGDDQTIVVS
eukprot:184025_1